MTGFNPKSQIYKRNLLLDSRGWFLKAIQGTEEELPVNTGEIYFTCAYPGQTKGGHYHKIAKEWFTPVVGKAILKIIDLVSGEKIEIELNAKNPVTVFIPSGFAHAIFNNGASDFILCAYTDKLYEPEDTIPYTFE